MLKKFLVPVLSFLMVNFVLSFTSTALSVEPAKMPWGLALFLAFMITLCATGIFAFVGFTFPTHRLLPKEYYRVRYPKKVSMIFRLLGVELFRKLLLLFFWGKKDKRSTFFKGGKEGINGLIFQSKQAEFGHVMAFILISIIQIMLLTKGYELLTLIMLPFNLIGNLYPVILQRHHRMRIQRLQNI